MIRPRISLRPTLGCGPGGAAAVIALVGIAGLALGAGAGQAHAAAPRCNAERADETITIRGQPGSPVPVTRPPASPSDASPTPAPKGGEPVHDTMIFGHVLFNQLEGRTNGPDTELRWDGEAWVGTDYNRLWLKSEGFYNERGKVTDSIQEVLYDRPVGFLRYFDWQAGLRYDLDSSPGRAWGAFGVEGLAPGFFEVEATLYLRDAGHVAGRVQGSYDLLLTNRLIAQPLVELNMYNKDDRERDLGAGLAEIDTGLRIRYEISRKFAPYVGLAYAGRLGDTAALVRREGESADDVRFIFGFRVWY